MSSTDSPQFKLLLDLGRGFAETDLVRIEKSLDKDFRYITYPKSLNVPERNRKEFLDSTERRMSRWSEVGSVSYLSC